MSFVSYLFSVFINIQKFVFSSSEYEIFVLKSVNLITFRTYPDIVQYNSLEDIPSDFRRILKLFPFINPLYFRIKSRQAFLLCLIEKNELVAYGYIQSWYAFNKKFGWLTKNGTMLGPYWTSEKMRGKGIYGRLLNHSIAISKNLPLVIYTNPQNLSSKRGIEKTGFNFVGIYRIRILFRILQWHKRINSN
ncbi:MAG: hypothetical protein KJN64_11000 [Ignavibacteria bacterium]|nr:hypothetical protein [Ignavibacteria bacterium]MBT8382029.1 hypothetical protein [Ignavibacteria bacterium]MBT8392910.1 hypothetical protein [Ignavibacteria bacterium]NNL21214.1 hypothetical protein [Ignavibacteriaceae bacterium]